MDDEKDTCSIRVVQFVHVVQKLKSAIYFTNGSMLKTLSLRVHFLVWLNFKGYFKVEFVYWLMWTGVAAILDSFVPTWPRCMHKKVLRSG